MSNETCEPTPAGDGHQTDFATGQDAAANQAYVQSHNLQDVEQFCCTGLSPRLMTGLVMRILSNHFANPALIMDPSLKQYVWAQDPTLSKLRIVPNTRFDPVNAGKLPALIVKRGDIQSARKLFGDRIGTESRETGAVSYVRFVTGQHRIFCIAEADGEAENLALEVFHTLTFLGPAVVDLPYMMDFQVVGMGELGVLEGLGNRIGVPIDINYAFEDAWTIQPLAPRLKTLNIDIT